MFSVIRGPPIVFAALVLIVPWLPIGNSFSGLFPKKFVPQEFVDSYKGFSTDIVANEIFMEHSNTYGVSAASTFGIGYLMALLNEDIFSIPREGFDEALRIQLNAIGFAYRDLVESLLEDPNVKSTSTLYVSNKSLEATETIKSLKTNVWYQDFSQPQLVVPTINSKIAIQTNGKIYDKLIPRGGWYGPSIWSFTKGVYINTLYYQNQFAYPFVDVGNGYFVTDKVPMIAAAGNFLIKRLPEYTVISLPFQDKRKSLVLVLPKDDLTAMAPYLEEALDYTKTEGVELKPLIVQLPAWNFTVSNEYFSQLYYMGVNNTMCNWKDGNEHFLQPVAQALYFYLDANKFEIASATGAQLNDNQEFQLTTGLHTTTTSSTPYATNVIKKNKGNIIQTNNVKTTDDSDKVNDIKSDDFSTDDSRSRFRSIFSGDDVEEEEEDLIESDEQIDPAKHLELVGDQIHAEKIVFDRPFYWYLKDEVVGPVFTGLVNSYRTYKREVVAVEEAFDDLFKYQFWSCAPKHLALMEAYTNAIQTREDEDDIALADGLEDTEINYDEIEE